MAFSWGQPITLRGPRGLDGRAGVSFSRTNGKPTDQGQDGEMRLDPNAFVIWSWTGSDWTASASFAGTAGMAGPVDYFAVTDKVPDASLYSGDGAGLAIVKPSCEVYFYSKEKGWSDGGLSLKGDRGDIGPQGVRGSYRYVMSTPPPSDTSGLDPQPMKGDEWVDTGTAGGPYVSFFS